MINANSDLCASSNDSLPSCATQSLNTKKELIRSSSLAKALPVQLQKSISGVSQADLADPILSSSSTFCASLYSSSSSANIKSCLETTGLPFLPPPPKLEQQHSSAGQSSSSSLLLGDGPSNGSHGDAEYSYDVKAFLNLFGDSSGGNFYGGGNAMAFSEQMEFQLLSEQLGIAITDYDESHRLDDIYDRAPDHSPILVSSSSEQEYLHHDGSSVKARLSLSPPSSSGTATCSKTRMRWTLELHERFVETLKKLGGPEKATPKGVLKLMKVEGLTMYHIKSHLQNYRLAKYLPETKKEKRPSKDKKAQSAANGIDPSKKKSSQIAEALRMQMEVQKQLYEQLEVQRKLQLRIEEHSRYVQKMLEQQKARKSMSSTRSSTDGESP